MKKIKKIFIIETLILLLFPILFAAAIICTGKICKKHRVKKNYKRLIRLKDCNYYDIVSHSEFDDFDTRECGCDNESCDCNCDTNPESGDCEESCTDTDTSENSTDID